MQVDNTEKVYGLSRKAASELLKVSMRTLDRYVKSKRVSTRTIQGRIWLSKEEVEGLRWSDIRGTEVDSGDMSTPNMSTVDRGDNVDNIEVLEQGNVHTLSSTPRKTSRQSEIYKKLFEELKEDLHEKQERLEIANYRVGQLETQLRNSIPMLEYHHENYLRKKHEDERAHQIEESVKLIDQLKNKLKIAKFNKRLFIIILLVVLTLQPLWLLLHFDNFPW